MAKSESSSFVTYLVIGGIGYYLYSQGYLSKITDLFGSSSTPIDTSNLPTVVDPSIAANAAAAKANLDYAAAVKAGDEARIAQALKDAANAQVIIGNPRDPRTMINCLQPNIIKDGVCVDPFTLQPPTLQGLGEAIAAGLGSLGSLGCDCNAPTDKLVGIGQILDFGDFFSLQPHRKHLTGNFK